MKKLITPLMAALVLSLGGFAFAAEETQQQQGGDPQREQEYQAALKKCDTLPQAERPKCIEAAKKKFGQM